MVAHPGGVIDRACRYGRVDQSRGREHRGQNQRHGHGWVGRARLPSEPGIGEKQKGMIGAFFRALLEIIAELIKGEVKKDIKATDADAPPQKLRDRFRRKLERQLRDK